MNEDELLRQIAEKQPEDLSDDAIAEIRSRLRDSERLQKALSSHLRFEQYLGGLLGDSGVTADGVFAEIGVRESARRRRRRARGFRWLIVLIGLGGGIFALVDRSKNDEEAGPSKDDTALVAVSDSDASRSEASTTKGDVTENEPSRPNELGGDDPPAVTKADVDTTSEPPVEAAVENIDAPIRPFQETRFEIPNPRLEIEGRRNGQRWFQKIGNGSRTQPKRSKDNPGRFAFQGTVRLRRTWPDSGVLRLRLREEQNLRIHLEGDDALYSIAYASSAREWIAYRSERPAEDPERRKNQRKNVRVPVARQLLETDVGLWHRSGGDAFELRAQRDRLCMTRGDLLLLSIPLAGAPRQTELEGRATVETIELYRGEEVALYRGVDWKEEAVPSEVRSSLDVISWDEVTSTEGKSPEASSTKRLLGRFESSSTGLSRVRFRLDGITPGSSFAFADGEGKRIAGLDFYAAGDGGSRLRVRFTGSSPSGKPPRIDARRQLDPLVGESTGFEVVWGPTIATLSIVSNNGRLSRVARLRESRPLRPFSSVLLSWTPRKEGSDLELREFEVRPLAAIRQSAPTNLRAAADKWFSGTGISSGDWMTRVLERQPKGAGFDEWVRAAAVSTLASGAGSVLSQDLLLTLAAVTAGDTHLTFPEMAQRLDEIALVGDTYGQRKFSEDLAEIFARAAMSVFRDPGDWTFVDVHRWLLHAPLAPHDILDTLPTPLVERALLELVHEEEWHELSEMCARLRFFLGVRPGAPAWNARKREGLIPRLEWAEGLLLRHLPEEEVGDLAPLPRSQQHPLEVELSKEGYNTIAEFDSALNGQAFEDACRIITASNESAASGLLPDTRDSDLLVSLRAAVALAMRAEPALRRAMEEQFGELGRLRLTQATTRGDRSAVESATVQFYGTGAAVDAHVWLGDRALSGGRLSRAVASYLQALEFVGPADRAEIEARMRLVGALEGREVGSTVNESVELNGVTYSAQDFEALVQAVREERSQARIPGLFPTRPSNEPEMRAGRYDAREAAKFQMRNASRPNGLDDPRFDWISRQVGVTLHGSLAVVGERNAVSVHEVATQKRRWAQNGVGAQGAMNRWPLVAMKPLVVRDRVFARLLKKDGPQLQCLDLETGPVKWFAEGYHHVASDPIWVEDEVVAVTAEIEQEYVVRLRLTAFDPETGEVIRHHPLTRFRDAWSQQIPCRVTRYLDRLIVAAGGSVLCVGARGRLHWVRRQPWVPPRRNGKIEARTGGAPVVSDGRVFVTQPGVPAIECLHLETGRLLWREFFPTIDRLVGLASSSLIATTKADIVALDVTSGDLLWSRAIDGLGEVHVGGVPAEILALSTVSLESNGRRRSIAMHWLDPRTGKPLGRSSLEPGPALRQQDLAIGPVVVDPERLGVVVGRRGHHDRTLLTLEREREADRRGLSESESIAPWARRSDAVLGRATSIVFPSWSVVASPQHGAGGLVDEWRGRKRVLLTRARSNEPLRLARSVQLTESGSAKLRLEIGRGDRDRFTLRVRSGGEQIFEAVVDEKTTPPGWKTFDVDVKGTPNSRVWVIVEQHLESGQGGEAYWGAMELRS